MVGTSGRLIRVHSGAPSGVWAASRLPGSVHTAAPAGSAPTGGNSHPGRNLASSAATGGWAYGEMPDVLTVPSQAYRAESSENLGGAPSAAAPTSTAPATSSAVVPLPRGVRRATTNARAATTQASRFHHCTSTPGTEGTG